MPLKKEDFAKKIGVADIYKYEKGSGLPKPETFKRICDELGASTFLDNPAIMQQIIAIDKERYPFSYQLKLQRFKNGMKMQTLADAIGKSRTVIGYYEDDTNSPDAETLEKICHELKWYLQEASRLQKMQQEKKWADRQQKPKGSKSDSPARM